jgi:hypothetical protein
MCYSDGPIALHVAEPSYRTRPAAGAANISLEEKEVHNFLDCVDGISMLCEPHRPAANDAVTSHGNVGSFSDLPAGQAA